MLTSNEWRYRYDNKLQAKDLINLGLFTVLYFVIGCCVAIPIGFVPIFLPVLGSLWSLITGIPFMLFLTRVKKFGMVTIMGVLSGLLMGLTGMGFWGVPMGLIFGLLGDLILKSGDYKSAKKSILGYAVFSLWMVGTYIPMYFMVEDSWASFAASFGEEYADRVMAVMPMWSIILVVAGIFVFSHFGRSAWKSTPEKTLCESGNCMMEGVSFSATTDNRRGIRLDPRTKLILLLTVTTLMFSTSNEGIMNFIKTCVKPDPLCADPVGTPLQNGRQVSVFISCLFCIGTHSSDDIKWSVVLCGFGNYIHYDAVCPRHYDGGLSAFFNLSQ